MSTEAIKELAENINKSFVIDGEDESWSIYVDDLNNGQYLVMLVLRDDDTRQFALADNVNELAEIVGDILYHNELG